MCIESWNIIYHVYFNIGPLLVWYLVRRGEQTGRNRGRREWRSRLPTQHGRLSQLRKFPLDAWVTTRKTFFALENCTHYKVRLAILSKPRLEKKKGSGQAFRFPVGAQLRKWVENKLHNRPTPYYLALKIKIQ